MSCSKIVKTSLLTASLAVFSFAGVSSGQTTDSTADSSGAGVTDTSSGTGGTGSGTMDNGSTGMGTYDSGRSARTSSSTYDNANHDEGFDWGLLGLLGLAGLAGLKPRRDNVVHERTHVQTRP